MTTRRKKPAEIYMGVDPGTANTGVAICSWDGKKFVILHFEVIRTSAKLTTRERFDAIDDRLVELMVEYDVKYVVCEAFEVRGWQKARAKASVMSKLINAISQTVFAQRTLFTLSSPDIKKDALLKKIEAEMEDEIYAKKCSYFEHAQDALRHVLYWTVRGSK